MLPRLEGGELEKDPSRYIGLVKKGVAGFILFGGRLDAVRASIAKLQKNASLPLIIASDLERGLGQQVEGGTVFPPAMAFGSALANGIGKGVLQKAFSSIAAEARWAGINMIFAPVLDINSNPENPIIATRAFGEEPETVSRLGALMAAEIEKQGLYACGKHFPGHGDTHQDSHMELPVIEKTFAELEKFELKPFRAAIRAGISAIMTGHLKLPLIDPSGLPATLSAPALGYLRTEMGFTGLLITDALNMAGAGGQDEGRKAELAIMAGADVLLHPVEPHETARYLLANRDLSLSAAMDSAIKRIRAKREALSGLPEPIAPDFKRNKELARKIALGAISFFGKGGKIAPPDLKNLVVVILSDAPQKLEPFMRELKDRLPAVKILLNPHAGEGLDKDKMPAARGGLLVVAHSNPEAWKPQSAGFRKNLERFSALKPLWISFGNPYVIPREARGKALAYSDMPEVQQEMARRVAEE